MSTEKRKKNFVIFSLVMMLCLIGYVNYNLNKESLLQTSSELEQYKLSMMEESGMLSDLLNDEDVFFEDDSVILENDSEEEPDDNELSDKEVAVVDSRDEGRMLELTQEASTNLSESITSQEMMQSSAYFIEGRIERDKTRSEMISHLNQIIVDETTSAEMKSQAEDLKLSVISNVDREVVIENMIKAKGFNDALVYLTDDSISTVVHATSLNEKDVAQILDVIRREASTIPLDNVIIMNKK
ncbi:SpoIIIAH-like family protein [Serpentinicella sp. ANB-PHB4]|uniref:SpoIIIAH-like family protein n=1 Tax=Serpentinicella sp. ANB-PHB4 TaxID=3074076 RepID=UPI0028583CA8|nr:SpoIIIAH-like family protein [Serpentinicella sp. ANB-PHB4]MDR5658193.1 SpoIIIAH-like family protein [Serpentinicella sp. ANB-PHB4]